MSSGRACRVPTPPPARPCTATRPTFGPPVVAIARSTATGSVLTVSTATMTAVWRSASAKARSRAIWRTTNASGIANASATIEVTAMQTYAIASLSPVARSGSRPPARCVGTSGTPRSPPACGAASTGERRSFDPRPPTVVAIPPPAAPDARQPGRVRLALREVDPQVAGVDDGRLLAVGPPGPAQHRGHPRVQVRAGERLDHVVVGAGL